MLQLKWDTLSIDRRKVIVDILLRAAYSRAAIGTFLGTTKNAVVGCQHTHLPWLTKLPAGSKLSISPSDAALLLDQIDFDKQVSMIERKKAEYVQTRSGPTSQSKKRLEETVVPRPKIVPLPTKRVAESSEAGRCRYPVQPGTALKQLIYCEETAVYGGCCHRHATELFSSYRRTHTKSA